LGKSRPSRSATSSRARAGRPSGSCSVRLRQGGPEQPLLVDREEGVEVSDQHQPVVERDHARDVLGARHHHLLGFGDRRRVHLADAVHNIHRQRDGPQLGAREHEAGVRPVVALPQPETPPDVEHGHDRAGHVDRAEDHLGRARQRRDGDHRHDALDRLEVQREAAVVDRECHQAEGPVHRRDRTPGGGFRHDLAGRIRAP
jgi:hypothetical protein